MLQIEGNINNQFAINYMSGKLRAEARDKKQGARYKAHMSILTY